MQAMIIDCGGLWSAKITKECTHLIATEDQYSKNGAKGMFEQLILRWSLLVTATQPLPCHLYQI